MMMMMMMMIIMSAEEAESEDRGNARSALRAIDSSVREYQNKPVLVPLPVMLQSNLSVGDSVWYWFVIPL